MLLAVVMLVFPASAQQATSGKVADGALQSVPSACVGRDGYAHCSQGCEPGKLIFLPCMAVGATNMANCREREVAACLRACTSRHCS
ncbi:MAG: hypothetical protein AAF637_13975 [Pseudomonadota bacterium]